jgi:diaminopimelate decarboxylase
MDHFSYRNDRLFAESVALSVIAEQVGTPCYVYSRAMIEQRWHAFDDAFEEHDHLLCYAVKANSNLGVLSLLARLGCGFDIVSGGELERVLRAGGDPSKVVFSGVGKSEDEIRRALEVGIYCFNVESETELVRLNAIAASNGQRAPTALRVNPDVDLPASLVTSDHSSWSWHRFWMRLTVLSPSSRTCMAKACRCNTLILAVVSASVIATSGHRVRKTMSPRW